MSVLELLQLEEDFNSSYLFIKFICLFVWGRGDQTHNVAIGEFSLYKLGNIVDNLFAGKGIRMSLLMGGMHIRNLTDK